MGLTSVAVCGLLRVAAVCSADFVGWRIHTGTIGTMEGPLPCTVINGTVGRVHLVM